MKVLQGIHGFPPIDRTKSSSILLTMDQDESHLLSFTSLNFTDVLSCSVTTIRSVYLIRDAKIILSVS